MIAAFAPRVALCLGALALAASAAAILPAFGGLALFAAAFLVFTAPGWGLARFYGGADLDPASLIALALFLGLLAGSLIYCGMRLLRLPGPFPVLGACALAGGGLRWAARRPAAGVVQLARLGAADRAAIGALVLVVALIVGPVFANIGRSVDGQLSYRAYFFADLFAHMSVVGELEKQAIPTVNPFMITEPLPYYWTYFSFPAVFAMLRPDLGTDRGLLLTALVGAPLFVTVWFMVVRSLGGSTLATAAAWITVIGASSFEGAALLGYHWRRGAPFWAFREYNVDALTRWWWDLPGIDGLHRLFWYTPQHGTAITAGLLALATFALARDGNAPRRGVVDGLLLGAALACSSFNGLMLVAWYAVAEVVWLAVNRGRDFQRWIVARAIAAALVLAALVLLIELGMIQRSANVAQFGWNSRLLRAPATFALLSFGAAPLLALIGWRRLWRLRSKGLVASLALALVCALVLMFVELKYHQNTYVPFRVGHLFYLVLALWLAFAIDVWRGWRRPAAAAAWAVLALLALLAAPTVALDWYNTRDIYNVNISPGGFPWTVRIGADEQAALAWIRASLPEDATVQPDGWARGRATWALIPALARRRMASGAGLFEPDQSRFEKNLNRIRTIFQSTDAADAHFHCRRIGVDYLYVGDVERGAYADGVLKFDRHPEKFERVFGNGAVQIYKVLAGGPG